MDAAEKLLARMRRSKSEWSYEDLCRLYEGYGFVKKEGSKHCLFKHPKYPHLRATVARHRTLAVGYIQHAIVLIGQLKAMEEAEGGHTESTR